MLFYKHHKMNDFSQKRILSLKHALNGLKHVIRTQKNTRIYLIFTFLVLILAGLLRVQWIEWLILITLIGLVWAAECFNTAVEASIDLITDKYHPLAKIAKDASAAGVAALAITAAISGLLIFGKYLLLLLGFQGD